MIDFTCYNTQQQIPIWPVRNSFAINANDDGNAPKEMYFAKKYILDLHVSCSFYANNANYEEARRQAEKMATEVLFSDVYRAIHEIATHAIVYGDPKIMAAIEKAKAICRGE